MTCLAVVGLMLRKQLKNACHCISPDDRMVMLKAVQLLLQQLAHVRSFTASIDVAVACKLNCSTVASVSSQLLQRCNVNASHNPCRMETCIDRELHETPEIDVGLEL